MGITPLVNTKLSIYMDKKNIDFIAILKVCVGLLGEKSQHNWWQSSFFTKGSNAFLSPLFSRTQVLAQCNGVTRAAALIHDESIGIGHVYHLFRLREDMEQSIHHALLDEEIGKVIESIGDPGAALDYLKQSATEHKPSGEGPIRVGKISDMQNEDHWKIVAGYYWRAFQEGLRIFPYFSNIS